MWFNNQSFLLICLDNLYNQIKETAYLVIGTLILCMFVLSTLSEALERGTVCLMKRHSRILQFTNQGFQYCLNHWG